MHVLTGRGRMMVYHRLVTLIGLVLLASNAEAWCEVQTSTATYTNGTNLGIDVCGATGGRKTELSTLLSGEDQTNNLLRVEHQYSRGLAAGADTSIKSGAGYLHALVCSGSDAAATAGDIAVRDATAAGAGTVILPIPIAAALPLPQPIVIDVPFTTGLFLDFTTTNDVTCLVSYR